jgi:membrane protein
MVLMDATGYWQVLKDAGSQWVEDRASRLGAALAYYTAFSLAPLLILVISIAALVFDRSTVEKQVTTEMQTLVGGEGAKAVQAMIVSGKKHGSGVMATIIGSIMLLVGAMGVFGQLQDAMNTIWEVQPKPGRGLWGFLRDRLLSMSMVLGSAFLLLVSLLVSAALAAVENWLLSSRASAAAQASNLIVSLIVITLLFAMIYRFLPDAKIAWRDVWLGALITALLFMLGKWAIGLYLGRASVASSYGAAGSLAVLLIWLYYSAQIFLFGAEFTKAYANRYGSHIVPTENAIRVTPRERAEQGMTRPPFGSPAR